MKSWSSGASLPTPTPLWTLVFLVFFAFEWEAMDEQAEKSRVEEAGKPAHHSLILGS